MYFHNFRFSCISKLLRRHENALSLWSFQNYDILLAHLWNGENTWGFSRKTIMGVFDGTYPHHPWDLITVRSTTHKIKLSVSPITHITLFFLLKKNPSKELEKFFFSLFFVFKPQQPTRSHLNEGYQQNCISEKDNHGLKNNQPLPTPQKYSALPSKTPICFRLEQPLDCLLIMQISLFWNLLESPPEYVLFELM